MPSIIVKSGRDVNGNSYYTARGGSERARVQCDPSLSQAENERAAVARVIQKVGWTYPAWTWHRSGLPACTGYEAVYVVPNEQLVYAVISDRPTMIKVPM